MNGWLALLDEAAGDLSAPATEIDAAAGWLCAWTSTARPHPSALRVDDRLLAADGLACRVSLVLLAGNARLIADDPLAIHARRAVLRDGRLSAISILTEDPVHVAGAISLARTDRPEELLALGDDPFARLGHARHLDIEPGVLGWVPLAVGPVVERYAGAPWPAQRW